MEDVLTLYARPYETDYPVVCLDEKIKYLLDSPRPNLPMRAGSNEKQDYEYKRQGSANGFVMVEPKPGKRHVMDIVGEFTLQGNPSSALPFY